MARFSTSVFVASVLIMSGTVTGAEARSGDGKVIFALYHRAINLGSNISVSSKEMADNEMAQMQAGIAVSRDAPVELTCLLRLSNATDRVGGELYALFISVALSETAIAPLDRAGAVEYSRLTVHTARDIIAGARDAANGAAGDCPQSAIVNQKAQDVLSFMADSETAIDNLSNEIGPSKYLQP
jgi:hypothetical protein